MPEEWPGRNILLSSTFETLNMGLLKPVLELAAETVDSTNGKGIIKVAGLCGPTAQAVAEAELAASLGYDAGLLSLGALKDASVDELIDHCRAVADTIPVFGFYPNEAVGGRLLSLEFWQRFVEIPNVVAIKIAAFNRYQTFDVVRAVAEAGRAGDIALTQVMMTTFCSILSPNTRSLLLEDSRNYIFFEVFSVIGRFGRRAPSPCSKKLEGSETGN